MFIAALLIIPSYLLITPFRGGSKKEQRVKNDPCTLILSEWEGVNGTNKLGNTGGKREGLKRKISLV